MFSPGEAKNTYGTGNFMLLNTGSRMVRSTSGLITTMAYALEDVDPAYALEGSVAVTRLRSAMAARSTRSHPDG